jgi:hypothetical protein
MVKSAHNLMAYNSQICVDDKFKFIVATDVTSQGTDKQELYHMAMQTKEVITSPDLVILADKGYYSAVEIKKCIDDGIKTLVPAIRTGQELINKGKFTKDKFIYNKDQDAYICPNNKLISRTKSINKSYARVMHIYRSSQSDCNACSIRNKCLGEKTKQKQTQRWEHQELLDNYNKKLDRAETKALFKKRGSIVEHPFGTIKRNLGWDHFLVRSKKKVQGENALIMFTYNFKRLLNIIGIALFKRLIIALKDGNLTQIKEDIALHIASFRLYMLNFLQYIFMVQFSKKLT